MRYEYMTSNHWHQITGIPSSEETDSATHYGMTWSDEPSPKPSDLFFGQMVPTATDDLVASLPVGFAWYQALFQPGL